MLIFVLIIKLWAGNKIDFYKTVATLQCHKKFRVLAASFNPFLFIRRLSCPSCMQVSLSLNFLKLTIPGFPHNCLPVSCSDIGLIKSHRSSSGLEIRPQSAFSAFRALLLSANYIAE
jgi:hypothetical protein